MEEPRALIDRPLLDEPVVIVTVASIREVACQDPAVAEVDVCLSLVDFREPGGEVLLGPTLGSSPVARPAPVVVAREEQLASRQLSDECEGLVDASERDITQHPDSVVGVDGGVPSLDQRLVHRRGVSEGSARVVDDVGVTEVEISGEPRRHVPMILPDRTANVPAFLMAAAAPLVGGSTG